MQEYSQADLKRLFHVPAGLVRSLEGAKLIVKGVAEGRTAYPSEDLSMLRMAAALKAAKVPSQLIMPALAKIRAALPPGSVLTAIARAEPDPPMLPPGRRVSPPGRQVSPPGQQVVPLAGSRSAGRLKNMQLAEQHYSRGHALEDSDVAAARAAYLAALNAHGGHLEARINLGRLLHLQGELQAAEKVYRQARTSSALLSFNLAILLEDLNREAEAVAAYRQALALDPMLYDAHFNLAQLHEKALQPRDALRHLLAYRRHIGKYGR